MAKCFKFIDFYSSSSSLVNQGIQEHQSRIKSTQYEREALLGKLNNLRHKLLEEQLEEKWMTIRENILLQQKENCCTERNTLQTELVRTLV